MAFNGPFPLRKPNYGLRQGNITPLSQRPSLEPAQPNVRTEMVSRADQNTNVNSVNKTSNNSRKKKRSSKNKGNNGTNNYYIAPEFTSSDSSSSSGSDDFSSHQQRATFYDDDRNEPVPFVENVVNTTTVQELEPVIYDNYSMNVKFIFNIASFAGRSFTEGNYVDEQYEMIFNRLSREVMSKVRSATLTTAWTFSNFYTAMQDAMRALELFYTIDSIISYRSDHIRQDKNAGVIGYQIKLESSDLLIKKDNLRRALKGVWVPKKMSELIRWMYQLYKVSPLDQALNYRFMPSQEFVSTSPSGIETAIDAIIIALQDTNSIKIYTILSDLIPEGRIVGLPKSCSKAVYDERHFELFSNQPVIYQIGADTKVFPHMGLATNGSLPYGLVNNTEVASGFPFALQTIYGSAVPTDTIVDFFRVGYTTGIGYNCNKFFIQEVSPGTIDFFQRSRIQENNDYESADVHWAESDGTSLIYRKSSIKPGFQPVFFDTSTAPLINLRNFMDSLFGL